MKVLFFINRVANKGGSERVTIELANAMVARGYKVLVLTWMGGAKSFYKLDANVELACLFEKDVPIYTYYLTTLFKYQAKLNHFKPDVVIDVCTAMSLFSVPLHFRKKYKLISWEHFNTTVNWNVITPRLARYLASKFANGVVVLTQRDKQSFIDKFKPQKIAVIPNPITIEIPRTAKMSNHLILAVGRLTYQKGFDLLLNSWKLIFEKYPSWTLAIVGDGEDEMALKQQAKQMGLEGSMRFYPATNKVQEYFSSASLFALSSRFEGLPLVLIEAKAFGLPIVSFNCPTGPEDIVVNEKDGFLVQPENQVLFSQSLAKLMDSESLRQEFSIHALNDVARFKLEPILDKWIKFINQL
jgi:glycosyltransferase involved in cell wall biosynthesis